MDLQNDSVFPSLPTQHQGFSDSILGARPNLPPQNKPTAQGFWKDLLGASSSSDKPFPVSYVDPGHTDKISFSASDLCEGQKEWEMCLVGHAIGKRPFYGALLAAVQRQWKLKGGLELLSFEGDFFLFKFSCKEDYNTVWNSGHCFLNGRPFIFKKWSKDFRPVKEEFSEIPIWVKFPNFPLCCWNELGISKVASKIGVPLAVDSLTAAKSRISFARVCVQVSPSSSFPDFITLDLDGMEFQQPVIYDWKPVVCKTCNTFSHNFTHCPLNPIPSTNRGRSRSRGPNFRRKTILKNSLGEVKDNPGVGPSTVTNPDIPTTIEKSSNNISDLNKSPVSSPVTLVDDIIVGEDVDVVAQAEESNVVEENTMVEEESSDPSTDPHSFTTVATPVITVSPTRLLTLRSHANSTPKKQNGLPPSTKPNNIQSKKKGSKTGNSSDQ